VFSQNNKKKSDLVALIQTLAFRGLEAVPVEVQVHLAPGHHAFSVVGLADKSVAESRDRVRAALGAIGLSLPYDRITINLSPADLPKEGSHYDLPIAIGLLVAMGALAPELIEPYFILGELGLDGRCSSVPGCLPAAMAALSRDMGLICPEANGAEAAWSGLGRPDQQGIVAAPHLLSILNHLTGKYLLPTPQALSHEGASDPLDLSDIRGQVEARMILEVAAAGAHNLLMVGPPGAGKSMLAARLPSILPKMTAKEALELGVIESLSGGVSGIAMTMTRPFRAPHHSASMAALIGGGRMALPGEVSLAHNGVLFLDELPEFPRSVLDALRQPIETGDVHIARAAMHVTYPAKFQLIAAMNPCRCGFADDPSRSCHRLPVCMQEYLGRISGPLLDRFDMFVNVPSVPLEDVWSGDPGESSEVVATRVQAARDCQMARQDCLNRDLMGDQLMDFVNLDPAASKLLNDIVKQNRLSARGFARMLRVARSIADLSGHDRVSGPDISCAVSWHKNALHKTST
jgi:magnesium chelatase family protein